MMTVHLLGGAFALIALLIFIHAQAQSVILKSGLILTPLDNLWMKAHPANLNLVQAFVQQCAPSPVSSTLDTLLRTPAAFALGSLASCFGSHVAIVRFLKTRGPAWRPRPFGQSLSPLTRRGQS
jgi:hypothetical protein